MGVPGVPAGNLRRSHVGALEEFTVENRVSLRRPGRLSMFFQHSANECPRNTEKPEVSRSVNAGGTDKGSGDEIPECRRHGGGRNVVSAGDALRSFERKWR